jgi:hypothetical protein
MKPLSSAKIYYYWVYWVGNQHDYIGMSAPWNPNLTGGGYVLLNVAVWGFVDVYLRQPFLTWAICGILLIAFSSLLKYTQRYYLLDDHGTPTAFLSSQRPDSIRYVQPIARERFLQLVAPELASNSSLTVKTYWIDEQRHLIGLCSPGNRDFMVVVYMCVDLFLDMIRWEAYYRFSPYLHQPSIPPKQETSAIFPPG